MLAVPRDTGSRQHREVSDVPSGIATAGQPAAHEVRDDVIVGHRLASGYMSVHAFGQPCALCDGTPANPAPATAWGR